MGPIATSLLEQAGYELDQPNNRHVIVRSAVLDLHDDMVGATVIHAD